MSFTSKAHGACSRLEPHPKFSRVIITFFPVISRFGSKSSSFKSSKRYGFKACFEIYVKYFAGIISSVLISERSKKSTFPPNAFIILPLIDWWICYCTCNSCSCCRCRTHKVNHSTFSHSTIKVSVCSRCTNFTFC